MKTFSFVIEQCKVTSLKIYAICSPDNFLFFLVTQPNYTFLVKNYTCLLVVKCDHVTEPMNVGNHHVCHSLCALLPTLHLLSGWLDVNILVEGSRALQDSEIQDGRATEGSSLKSCVISW